MQPKPILIINATGTINVTPIGKQRRFPAAATDRRNGTLLFVKMQQSLLRGAAVAASQSAVAALKMISKCELYNRMGRRPGARPVDPWSLRRAPCYAGLRLACAAEKPGHVQRQREIAILRWPIRPRKVARGSQLSNYPPPEIALVERRG